MKTKFTKGKWHINGHYIETDVETLDLKNSNEICMIGYGITNSNYRAWTEEERANARLITAAPELLEALQMMVNEFNSFIDIPENYKQQKGWDGDENPRTVAYLRSLQVINKAIGVNEPSNS